VRTTAAVESSFDGRVIPPGMQGTVLDARADGSCLAELAFTPQTADATDGDFVQAVLAEGQYEVLHTAGMRSCGNPNGNDIPTDPTASPGPGVPPFLPA
jgi:hypothetical protein